MLEQKKIEYNLDTIEIDLLEFYKLYDQRPIKDNEGGMKSPHLFNTWFALKQLQPKLIIESGVWKGLGTWTIENALPETKLISIDINFSHLQYKSGQALYLDRDIKSYDWEHLLDTKYPGIKRDEIVVFLDDHQNFLDRIEFIYGLGIKHILYEDNYPPSQGDVLSPKKILACQDYVIDRAGHRQMHKFSFSYYDRILNFVKLYQELPPIFKLENTRWGDRWDKHKYPTLKPLLEENKKNTYEQFYKEADSYTWICYMELK
jgi:hypothetical protein